MGFIKALIGIPFILVVLIFAFVNNDMANFSLWPTGIEITISLSVAIVFLVFVGYLAGWLSTWMSYAPVRRALRDQKKQNKKLCKEQEKLAKEVEGLHGNIETLKASVPTPEKTSVWNRLNKFFASKDKADTQES